VFGDPKQSFSREGESKGGREYPETLLETF